MGPHQPADDRDCRRRRQYSRRRGGSLVRAGGRARWLGRRAPAAAGAAALWGRFAALDAAAALGRFGEAERDRRAGPIRAELARERAIRPFLDALYRPRDSVLAPVEDDTIACRCEEVSVGRIRRAVRLGAPGPNQLKAFTRCGMGPCQGRICGPIVSAVIAEARGVPIAEVGTYRPRAPYTPVTLRALAGMDAAE